MNNLDHFFFSEMMTHPALFAHPKPQKVTIIGNPAGILQEVLKHPSVESIYCVSAQQTTADARISFHSDFPSDAQDIVIQAQLDADHQQAIFKCLNADGILVQPCPNPLIQPDMLKVVYQQLKQVGFSDWQILNFPQAGMPSDWIAIVLATKCPLFKRIREKDIFNKPFSTQYYNFEIHLASLALPEFARTALK